MPRALFARPSLETALATEEPPWPQERSPPRQLPDWYRSSPERSSPVRSACKPYSYSPSSASESACDHCA